MATDGAELVNHLLAANAQKYRIGHTPHVDYNNLPTGWDVLPENVEPYTPIGE